MKKFLIATVVAIIAIFFLNKAYYEWGIYIDLEPSKPVTTFTAVDGKEILVDTGSGLKPFEIKGVNMGVGIPGHFSTEYAIDKETYLRWFRMIQDMGANTVRVYTILSSDFYEAVYEYNTGNPSPLYVIHGVWVNDYVQNSHIDAYDDSFFKTLKDDCRTLVDVLHGRKKMNLGYGTTNASGSYSYDISPWVIGYILGVEWEDVTVAYTDHMQPTRNSYQGTYLYTTEDATPFEAMLAEAGDLIINYESRKYKQQRLLAFSNWPTTDPLYYPETINQIFMKCAQIDVEHIKSTNKFLSGQFASYHVYSYYPDYLNYYDSWKYTIPNIGNYRLDNGDYNTYSAYLNMLNSHHTMPVVISEFGVPTSRGRAQLDLNTARSQGYMSEQEQGLALAESYQDIKDAGCAGSIIFSWQDEWFKRTWNTMANVDLNNTAYWSDFQTNEQFFGLLAFDPGREPGCYTDGQVEEWDDSDIVSQNGDCSLSMKYDEKFLYFRIHKPRADLSSETLYIPVDVTPKTGSYYAESERLRFDRPADFLIVLNGPANSRVLVQERYDAFRAVFSEDYGDGNPYFNPPDKDSPIFQPIYLGLQLANLNAPEELEWDAKKFETGKLTYGNGNPSSPDYNSVSDFICDGENIELRLPWQLLNFSDASNMMVHDDYYEHYGIENLKIDEIAAGIAPSSQKDERIPMNSFSLKGWGKHPTYKERLKQSYYIMQDLWGG